jgi:hypothetical protein
MAYQRNEQKGSVDDSVQDERKVWRRSTRKEGLWITIFECRSSSLFAPRCYLVHLGVCARSLARRFSSLFLFLLLSLRSSLLRSRPCMITTCMRSGVHPVSVVTCELMSLTPRNRLGVSFTGWHDAPCALRGEEEVAAAGHGQQPHVPARGGHRDRLAARAHAQHLGTEPPHVLLTRPPIIITIITGGGDCVWRGAVRAVVRPPGGRSGGWPARGEPR